MNWKETEGFQPERPLEIDTVSSPTTIYLRKNIEEVPNTDAEGKKTEGTHWKYEEAEILREDFAIIGQATMLENQRMMDQTIAEILLNQMEV